MSNNDFFENEALVNKSVRDSNELDLALLQIYQLQYELESLFKTLQDKEVKIIKLKKKVVDYEKQLSTHILILVLKRFKKKLKKLIRI